MTTVPPTASVGKSAICVPQRPEHRYVPEENEEQELLEFTDIQVGPRTPRTPTVNPDPDRHRTNAILNSLVPRTPRCFTSVIHHFVGSTLALPHLAR